jgi:hypothetical protein
MIKSINTADTQTSFCARNYTPSNKTMARFHYLKFLKAEDKFFKTTEIYEQQTKDLSLKTISTFGKAIKNFGEMAYQKLASMYYYTKK